ncbi:hypothetical protein [Rummeliibacillus suwonensis]|uniref:hypothetical protein n=1 Tax=Rummeliibacillus suwonensis TaxID=1306154 RepID=UPI001AAFA91F|nr:hypothetical protein [Rummeliibacillus suwonensis]MBO2535944.1 hypothetical protein [Rummeliibacillus suwonensis]
MEKKLEELEEQLNTLKEQIRLLSICKVTSDEFPYYNFLVTSGITSSQRSSINLFFLVLSELIKGKLTDKHIKVLKKLKAESILDEKNEIRYTEVMNTLKKILDVETSDLIEEMFDSMLRQGVKTNIVNHLKTSMVFDQL